MFRTKKDVDRHVKDIFIKLKSSEEKNLRCYNIAKLYYQVGDYESARKYVSHYLEVRDRCAGAHKLLGQTLEALGQKEGAFTQYKTSLEIEPKQDDLLLKVCELLVDMGANMDVKKVKYWVERANKVFPHHPIVFKVKEKMLTLEKPNGNDDDLEKLITSELSVRQADVHLQVKLLKHYIGNDRFEDAYNYAAGVEATHSHRNKIVWYQSLSELLVKCKESKQSDWTFWIFYISVLERYAALCLKEQGNMIRKSIADITQAVFNFDQSLFEFKSKSFSNHPAFIEHMLLHMWGQLHFHLVCLILRKTKAGEDSWSEAGRLCGPLLLTALHVTPIDPTAVWTMHLKDRLKNQVHVWYREGSYRCSQAGHVLQDYARDNTKKLLDKIDKFCTSSWRDRVYQRIFISVLYPDRKATSYFVNSAATNPPLRLCSYNELKRFDEISEEVWPDSLHHQVWLGLRARPHSSQNKDKGPHPNQTSRVFCDLQFSVYNLHQAAPDSLSRLDVDAFLNAAIFCAASMLLEEQQSSGLSNPDKLPTLPADLTNTLCTCAQEQWWSYAYKVYSMDKQKYFDDDLGELRLELQRGLEVVRCLGNHGLHPILLVHLARIFHYRAEELKEVDQENSDILDLETRSEMYWSAAIPLLERLQNNQVIRMTNSKFFNYQGKDMNNAEIIKALEEGKLLLAQRFVRSKQYEKAIEALQALKHPEASFQQGQMYEKLADEIVNSIPKDSLTSEMRSQHIIMLSKARECFYLTLDRLRSPGTNPKHPLNSELSTHMNAIDNKLRRIDPDLSRGDLSRNECDGMSDDSYSSAHSAVDQGVANNTSLQYSVNILGTPQKNPHRTPKQSSTPYRPQHQDILELSRNRSEARPSPERLDAQIRAINQTINAKDGMIQCITEQNKTILELNKKVMEKVEKLAEEVAELRKEVHKQRPQPVNVNPNLEEDLCMPGEDDYNDLNYNANQAGAGSSISGGIFPSSHRHPYSQLMYPSATFPGYYAAGMSFSDPNAQAISSLYPPSVYSMPVLYPSNRLKIPENIQQQGLFMPPPPTNQSLPISMHKIETSKPETIIKDAPVNKMPPVNVAITTSDTLPTTAPVVQTMFSVTIPPHFRQGASAAVTAEPSAPHCYQISMPSQATIPTTVNLPPLSNTLTTTPANISVLETSKQDTIVCSTGSANSSDHEHDPIPDFVPVIPLPAEVKVTTGEEGHETLFCGRAKLYRYVDNEWKERGIGNVKLLKNEEGKVRLVMRREQVFKVCANHYLTSDMELTAKPNNEKAWSWVAQDFADGELRLETFCIKFKTVEEGLSFKEHFDKAKASLVESFDKTLDDSTDKIPSKPIVTPSSIKKAEKTKAEAKPTDQTPFISGQTTQKLSSNEVTTTSEAVTPDKTKSAVPTTVVGGFSFNSLPIIQKVPTTEPSVKPPPKPETVSPFAGFTFNKNVTGTESFVPSAQKSTAAATTATSQFTFSFAKPATPLQSGAMTVPTTISSHSTPISSPQLAAATAVTTETVPANVPQLSLRRPHAPAPSEAASAPTIVGVQDAGKSAVQTEHEQALFDGKVTLKYHNSDVKQWENRGTGQLKILWSSKTNKIRLLMIDETTSKVCYNYDVPATVTFTLKSLTNRNNAIVNWSIQYGSDNKAGKFAATFKDPAQATLFYNTVTDTQKKMVKDCVAAENLKKSEAAENAQPNKSQSSWSDKFKPPPGSWECNACYMRNGALNAKCLACETPRPSSAPAKTATTTPIPASTTAPASNQQVPLSQLFKPPAGSWKCKCCEIVNAAESNYCVACDTPKDPSLPPKPKTDGFQIGTSSTAAGATPTFSFGMPKTGFTFRLVTDDASADSKSTDVDTKADTSAAKFVFGMQQKPSTPPTNNKDSAFVFGTPRQSFGFNFVSKSSPTKSGGEDDSEEEEEEESDDIHFSPIIPLPDKIDVKTGEEDEEVLYSHRAKLFRYDKSVNEWKERGLGDIKLLRHNESGKLRLVMRREQILKLCLNHVVLPSLELKPKDEKTWIWNAADYSEGEIDYTLFACRFKTSEVASSFKEVIDESKKKLAAADKTSEVKVETSIKASPTRDIEVLYEMKVTPEEKQAALALQLPENFYAYKQKPDCPGCRGCEQSDEPLFKDRSSEKAASKIVSEDRKPPTTTSVAQLPLTSSSLSSTTNDAATVETSISSTATPVSSVFKFASYTTSTTPFTSSPLSTATPLFGNTDSTASNDKKTGFSFVMPQTQNETQKSATENILSAENLKICSSISSQAQQVEPTTTPFSFMTSMAPTTSIFAAAKPNSAGKNIFGGASKKDPPGLLKPSSLSVSTNNSESVFSNNFNSPVKTTSTCIFGSAALKTNSESTIANASPLTATTTTTNVFDTSTKSTDSPYPNTFSQFTFNFGPHTTAPTTFTTSTPATVNAFETTPTTSEAPKEAEVAFLPTTDISFSTLAAKESTFRKDPNFSFAGAGAAVFGSKSNANATKSTERDAQDAGEKREENEEEESEQTGNDQDYDPHFEPIIPLPDIVEVHTGEEDEEKVFCERAKLYRYDDTSREWKERGVGQMKILHHAKYGTYRLLLRREQVHKVVCNFLLTPDVSFTKLSTSDRSWIWAGMNHAEEQPCLEKLAVKFKNTELATNFKDAVDKIQQTLIEKSREKSVEGDDGPIVEEPEDEENEEVEEEEVGEVEDEEEEEEEEHEYKYKVEFFKIRTHLLGRKSALDLWEDIALGNLIISHYPFPCGIKIILKADVTDKIVSETLVTANTSMQILKNGFVWTAVDRALSPPAKRNLCASFSSEGDALKVYSCVINAIRGAHCKDTYPWD